MARPKRQRSGAGKAVIAETIDRCRGIIEFCAKLKVSNRTAYRWRDDGEIPGLAEALAFAELACDGDPKAMVAVLRKIAPPR